MKKQTANQPIRITDNAIAQGPAGRNRNPEDEWNDGNGY